MNGFGEKARSWRKGQKRAVSPIIATILLVAITVVLAAVLYILISGLTKGPGNTPIGSAFTAGGAVASTCAGTGTATSATSACKAGNIIYTLTVESSTVSMGSVLFEVKTPAGSVYPPTGPGGFAIMPISGTAPACWEATTVADGQAMATACAPTGSYSTSTPLTSLFTIVIDMGSTSASGITGSGFSFVTIGIGSYSGSTSTALP